MSQHERQRELAERVDVESLLQPVSEDQPAGDDIREDKTVDSIYYAIKDARNAARAVERNNVFGDTSEADDHWRNVLKLAPDILQNHAKDLEVACWYIEALLRLGGSGGLHKGFVLLHGLVEKYWDDLYPRPDEYGMETRVAALTGLNGEGGAPGVLITPLINLEFTDETTNEHSPFTFGQYEQARKASHIDDPEKRAEQEQKNGFQLSHINEGVKEIGADILEMLLTDLTACYEEYQAVAKLLNELCGSGEAPSTSLIIETLENDIRLLKFAAEENQIRLGAADSIDEETADDSESGSVGGGSGASVAASGPIKNRQDGFRQLKMISEFFRNTEPHSPIPYIIDRAIQWGNLSLMELMDELIPDESSREKYASLTGVSSIKRDDDY